LYYDGGGHTAFDTSQPDLYGNAHIAAADGSETEAVHLNGVRITPSNQTLTGDYTFNATTSTVTLVAAAPAGYIVIIDYFLRPGGSAAGGVAPENVLKLTHQPIFDGTTTAFNLQIAGTGGVPNVKGTSDLIVVLDGVQQEPSVAYTATGAALTFAMAPSPDAACFILQLVSPISKIDRISQLPFDGVTTTFTMTTVSGVAPVLGYSTDLFVSLDGVGQEPDVAYTASGASITFAQAPPADAKFFALWWS
jgi:hypothetical protein